MPSHMNPCLQPIVIYILRQGHFNANWLPRTLKIGTLRESMHFIRIELVGYIRKVPVNTKSCIQTCKNYQTLYTYIHCQIIRTAVWRQ